MSTPPSSSANPSPHPDPTPPEPPRKFPAPCWTQEETLALINAYQDKWYSLRRRNLRSADWDAVATTVAGPLPRPDSSEIVRTVPPQDGEAPEKGFHGKRLRSRPGKGDVNFDSRMLNGLSNKNSGATGGGGGGLKRGGMDAVAAEMVASIKMLGDGFMKMEKMKMDMIREIEKMRMEMEMKRSEMILESQQLILNAFVEGLLDRKKKVKVKAME
ncbi:hypothetical protein Ancab_015617 [Ancistrocladus abbreviatus]